MSKLKNMTNAALLRCNTDNSIDVDVYSIPSGKSLSGLLAMAVLYYLQTDAGKYLADDFVARKQGLYLSDLARFVPEEIQQQFGLEKLVSLHQPRALFNKEFFMFPEHVKACLDGRIPNLFYSTSARTIESDWIYDGNSNRYGL